MAHLFRKAKDVLELQDYKSWHNGNDPLIRALELLRDSKALVHPGNKPKETLRSFLHNRSTKLGSKKNAAVRDCLEMLAPLKISDMYLKDVRNLLNSSLPANKSPMAAGHADEAQVQFMNRFYRIVTIYITPGMEVKVVNGNLKTVQPERSTKDEYTLRRRPKHEPAGPTTTRASSSQSVEEDSPPAENLNVPRETTFYRAAAALAAGAAVAALAAIL